MGRFKREFCGWLLVLGLFGGIVAAHAESPVWVIKGAKSTVYLAGYVRTLPQTDPKLPAAFDKAYADSATIVLEAAPKGELGMQDAQGLALMAGVATDDRPLSQQIGQERFDKLVKQAESFGMRDIDVALERFQPWNAAQTVHSLQLKTLGYDANAGNIVDLQIVDRARKEGKEITGFETLEEQVIRFAKLPMPQQIEFVDVTLIEMEDEPRKLNDIAGAWQSGNASKLASLLGAQYQQAPKVYATFLSDRNRAWVPQIQQMLKSGKNHMIVVGTLHIVGKDGLLELLKAKGISAQQMK